MPYFATDSDLFDQVMAMRGQVYRELEGRRTQRVEWGGGGYFIKQHVGVGWKEILKNLLQCRLPVISAKNEWLAIQKLEQIGVPTMQLAGFGCRGFNPARMQSFLITKELTQVISLEDVCRPWPVTPPPLPFKWALIKEVARLVRRMHENGVNHRDCYICHFLLDISDLTVASTTSCLRDVATMDGRAHQGQNARSRPTSFPKLYVIDLHRAQIRHTTPTRWIIKDLAGLYFSSKDSGLTSRDLWRFVREYRGKPLRDILTNERLFWQKVQQRGDKTYQDYGK